MTEIDTAPVYSGCALGGLTASVDLMGCTYRWTWKFIIPWERHVECKPGQGPPTITQGTCTISVPAQTLGDISVKNEGSGSGANVVLTLNESGMSYTGSTGCPSNVVGSHTDGTVTGDTVLKAFKDEGGKEGAQASLVST